MEAAERNRIERLLAILTLGICTAVEEELITLSEAERMVFSPCTMQLLEVVGASNATVNMIHMGTELDDIRSIIPDRYAASIKKLKDEAVKIVTNGEPASPELDSWLLRLCKD